MIAIRRCPGTLHLCANILKRVDTSLGQSSFRNEASNLGLSSDRRPVGSRLAQVCSLCQTPFSPSFLPSNWWNQCIVFEIQGEARRLSREKWLCKRRLCIEYSISFLAALGSNKAERGLGAPIGQARERTRLVMIFSQIWHSVFNIIHQHDLESVGSSRKGIDIILALEPLAFSSYKMKGADQGFLGERTY